MIDSVQRFTNIPYQLILVDNGSTDGTREYIKTIEGAKVILNNENLGYGGGMNVGLKSILNEQWEYVLFFNNDVIVTPGWLERLVFYINMPEDKCYISPIGMVGPVSNYVGGRQCVQTGLSTDPTLDNVLEYAEKHYKQYHGQIVEVSTVVGLCLLCKREVVEKIGMFDEQFFPGMWEDNDLCRRSRIAGYKHIIATDVFIYHYGSKTITANGIDKGREMFETNKKRYYDKWNRILKIGQPKKIVGMLRVRNMAKYIKRTLDTAAMFCSEVVVVDGNSNDGTYECCKEHPIVTRVEQREPPLEKGGAEADDRNFLLQMAKEKNGMWMYCMDGDEMFEDKCKYAMQTILNYNIDIDLFCFPVFTFWDDEDHYRADGIWGGMLQGRLFRNLPNQKIYYRKELGSVHCGSHPFMPDETRSTTFLRVKHYGYVDRANRERKYKWYTEVDKSKSEGLILGGYAPYYKKMYYGNERAVVQDADFYRHLIDEGGMIKKKWIENNSICLSMIAKNEEEHIANAINSVKPMIDECVVIDTGSTDRTVEIAQSCGAKVYHYPWNNEFSNPRNMSLRCANSKWILRLDADEIIEKSDLPRLWWLSQDDNIDIWIFPIHNFLRDPIVGDYFGKWAFSETCRMYKNDPRFFFSGVVHEEIDESVFAAQKRGERIGTARADFRIFHFGYLKKRKFVKQKLSNYFKMNMAQIKQTPDRAMPYHAVGLQYFYDYHDWINALKYMKIARQKDKNFWMAYNDAGVIEMERCNFYKAGQFFDEAKRIQDTKKDISIIQKEQMGEWTKRLRNKYDEMIISMLQSKVLKFWISIVDALRVLFKYNSKILSWIIGCMNKILDGKIFKSVIQKCSLTPGYKDFMKVLLGMVDFFVREPHYLKFIDFQVLPLKIKMRFDEIISSFYDFNGKEVKRLESNTNNIITCLREKKL